MSDEPVAMRLTNAADSLRESGNLPLADLAQWLKDNAPTGPFVPSVYYHPEMNELIAHWEDEPSYTEWINPGLSLIRSMEDNRVVGVEIAARWEDNWQLAKKEAP